MADVIDFGDEKRRRIAEEAAKILGEATPKTPRRRTTKPAPLQAGATMYISNSAEISGQIAGGDIHNHHNSRPVIKNEVIRGPEFISPAGARKIKGRIDTLVKMDVAAGSTNDKAYAKWWKILKDHFQVTSYYEIRADQEQQALDWLQSMKVLNRPKIRRTNSTMWRNDLYSGIWARQAQSGRSKADVYQLALEKLGKKVVSLKQLGERDLKALNAYIMRHW